MSQARLAKGEKEKALAMLEKAVAVFPGLLKFTFNSGVPFLANNDPGGAIASFTQAVKLAPEFPAAVLALAQVHIRQGNFVLAIDSLKAFLQRNPSSGEARLLLADGYRNQGNLEEALTIYRQLGVSAPRNPQVHLLTGLVLLQQDKRNEARQSFTKAVELSPGLLPAVEQLVNLDIAEKQYGAARARLEAYVTNSPKDAAPYLLLARLYLLQADNEKAEGALLKALELKPDSSAAYLTLAQLYINTKQLQKALPNLAGRRRKKSQGFHAGDANGSIA